MARHCVLRDRTVTATQINSKIKIVCLKKHHWLHMLVKRFLLMSHLEKKQEAMAQRGKNRFGCKRHPFNLLGFFDYKRISKEGVNV